MGVEAVLVVLRDEGGEVEGWDGGGEAGVGVDVTSVEGGGGVEGGGVELVWVLP